MGAKRLLNYTLQFYTKRNPITVILRLLTGSRSCLIFVWQRLATFGNDRERRNGASSQGLAWERCVSEACGEWREDSTVGWMQPSLPFAVVSKRLRLD